MRAFAIVSSALVLAACGSEVEPETVETLGNDMVGNAIEEPEPAPPEEGSSYTEMADCEIVAENRGEGGYVKRQCEGVGGYSLIVETSDLRDAVTLVTPEEEEEELHFSTHISEGRFNELGRTIEWRGPTAEEPRVMIARMNVANPEDPMGPDESVLAVVRLESPACIVARVPAGPSQNLVARRFADRDDLPDCLGAESEAEDDS